MALKHKKLEIKYDRGEEIKKLSIIIVTYNSLGYLGECLNSIYAHPPETGFDISIVDNASSDGTGEYIKKNHPGVALISNKENKGFAAASNQAITATDSRYVLLINSDCQVFEGSIERLLDYFGKTPKAAIAGPKIINSDGSIQYSCRSFPSFFGAAAHTILTHIYPDNPFSKKYKLVDVSRKEPFSVDWVSGSCMMIRRSALEDIGLLDESYFMYVEDIDICYRAWQKGSEVHYMPHSEVLHHVGGSSRKPVSQNGKDPDKCEIKTGKDCDTGDAVIGEIYTGGNRVSRRAAVRAS
ncbi:MAG: glycosyltransferase family 2 protein, partial [Actinomycetia bacterium]|nr:glycosyltransferase family 2 protein [Actinomycetes bacterium]